MTATFIPALLEWFATHKRPLAWRAPETTAWGVLVSEVMSQQTPVARVEPLWREWMRRWPTPRDLAAASKKDLLTAWGRLGYPRRALRLQDCATVLADKFDNAVPADVDTLLTLPGIGDYTARAVCAFAYGQAVPVVDTNVRRVIARAVTGRADAGPPRTRQDLAAASAVLPPNGAARVSAALMELGALVCTARTPRCGECPIVHHCAWQQAGCPPLSPEEAAAKQRRVQRFTGTDRQVRGILLAAAREATAPLPHSALTPLWSDAVQRQRALDSLLADGLLSEDPPGHYQLPN